MKKALAIFMAFALVGVFAFADVADIAVSGNATLTWGYDLDTEASGFKNDAEWKISIPLMAKQTFGTKSEGDNYAEINIKDAVYMIEGKHDAKVNTNPIYPDDKFTGGDKKIDKVEATLHFGKVYVNVYGGPDLQANYADIWDPIKSDKEFYSYKAGPGTAAGTKIGMKDANFEIAAKVASRLAMSANVDNEYAFGVEGKVMPSDMITVEGQANYGAYDDAVMGFGVKAEIKPVADFALTLAADAGKVGDLDLAYDFLAKAAFKEIFSAGVYGGTTLAESNVADDLNIAVFGKLSSSDLVENLNVWVTVMAYNLLNDATDHYMLPMAFHTGANYKAAMGDVNYFKPFVEVWGQSNYGVTLPPATPLTEDLELALAYNVGVEYGLFSNTTLTAKFEAGSTKDQDAGAVTQVKNLVSKGSQDDKGRFTLACKVSY